MQVVDKLRAYKQLQRCTRSFPVKLYGALCSVVSVDAVYSVDCFHPHLIRFSESECDLGEFNLLSVDFRYLLHEQNVIIINQREKKKLIEMTWNGENFRFWHEKSGMQHFILRWIRATIGGQIDKLIISYFTVVASGKI